MHREMIDDFATFTATRGQRRNYIAPRGFAKSTIASKAYPLYAALEGIEPYTLIFSGIEEQAEGFLADIRLQLETNQRIKTDYPHASGVGPLWQQTRIELRNGTRIEAKGAGGQVLGRSVKSRRPTLVIVDDANKRQDAFSPTTRQRLTDWMAKTVMPIGEPGHTNFVCVGTPIHREALVCTLKSDPTWKTRTYRSIERFPDSPKWAEWGSILFDLANQDRISKAREYYLGNRAEMDAGAELLWSERFPLLFLMTEKSSLGDAAFNSEYQDSPGTEGANEWPPEYFEKEEFWFREWPTDMVATILAIDPSKGANEKSDRQAHVLVGLSRDKKIYVEPWLVREDVTMMVRRSLDIVRGFKGVNEVIAETNSTMGLLIPEFRRQMQERGQVLNLMGLHNTDNKTLRIRGLTGYLANGIIRIRDTHYGRELVNEAYSFPNGQHDDGLDALATAIKRLEQLMA